MKQFIPLLLLLSLTSSFQINIATQPSTKFPWLLQAGDTLHQNESLISSNGLYRSTMKQDGNFIVYNIAQSKQIWSTNTGGQIECGPFNLGLGQNGNLILWGDTCKHVMWQSKTYIQGSYVVMQDNGNLVLYDNKKEQRWSCCK